MNREIRRPSYNAGKPSAVPDSGGSGQGNSTYTVARFSESPAPLTNRARTSPTCQRLARIYTIRDLRFESSSPNSARFNSSGANVALKSDRLRSGVQYRRRHLNLRASH
jgi:hypothetical protein